MTQDNKPAYTFELNELPADLENGIHIGASNRKIMDDILKKVSSDNGPTEPSPLGRIIRGVRQFGKFRIGDICKSVGITSSKLMDFEYGRDIPTADQVISIFAFMGRDRRSDLTKSALKELAKLQSVVEKIDTQEQTIKVQSDELLAIATRINELEAENAAMQARMSQWANEHQMLLLTVETAARILKQEYKWPEGRLKGIAELIENAQRVIAKNREVSA